ncbi:acyl CoA:acetate/3-ketoacid CoA transferase [Vulcanisaeta distributa]|uniref:Coenzyme A transferase n=1 Tax=Vulcanisaeta distributa (strain DSM 14429 / JCM 11212 / NBRC 100878 / IC-017) TaxID=572478 RepID=E1QUH0_VULDI|nr:acyl CoA:acetate/3-ketoacid CoA transferase [Vulcanisaeta distributa]ADN49896.1 coenzyme A transferase [Vulcanisaeta distributa DSM 14429]
MGKVVDVNVALDVIRDGDVIAVSGFNMATTPEYLLIRLYERYKETGHPRDLFIVTDTLPASRGRALDLIAERMIRDNDFGFIRGFMITFFGVAPSLQRLVIENRVEAYSFPIGVATRWFRSVASGVPTITKVGLGTFLDPRQDGIYLNGLARERRTCRVELISINGDEYLLYDCPKPRVGLIRGSTADEFGNLTMSEEAIYGSVLAITQAVKAQPNPGVVIAQVLYVSRFVNPRDVHVPGPLIDYIVTSPPEYHTQSASVRYDPSICGRVVVSNACLPNNDKPNFEYVIARRVVLEFVRLIEKLGRPIAVNLGIGIPALVAKIIRSEGVDDYIVTTVESGPWGGIALSDDDFGVAISPKAILPMPDQFIMYEGGIIDAASLGFMQVGPNGDVNPSFLPERVTGPGGFPVIVHGSPRLYFAGAFTAGKRDIAVVNGRLTIIRDGQIIKFIKKPYKVGFNAELGLKMGKEVLYITERAVFRLTGEGLVLEEYAPGVDIERDILAKMEFEPIVSRHLQPMDDAVFRDGPMGLLEVVEKAVRR